MRKRNSPLSQDETLRSLVSPGHLALIEDALAIERTDAKEAGALGYMAKVLAQVTMPHRKVAGNEFARTNGNLTLSIVAPATPGLPYGHLPRLMMAWVTTEAVKTKSSEIILGDSVSAFMRDLGITASWGKRGTVGNLQDQMARLFSSTFHCIYNDEAEGKGYASLRNLMLADSMELWWDPQKPDQAGLWQSKVILTDKFYKHLIERPVPVDLRALQALKKSPLALDIYTWATHRMSYLSADRLIPWEALMLQFGAGYPSTAQGKSAFKYEFVRQLKKVLLVYPEAKLIPDPGNSKGLLLKPSPTHVPMRLLK